MRFFSDNSSDSKRSQSPSNYNYTIASKLKKTKIKPTTSLQYSLTIAKCELLSIRYWLVYGNISSRTSILARLAASYGLELYSTGQPFRPIFFYLSRNQLIFISIRVILSKSTRCLSKCGYPSARGPICRSRDRINEGVGSSFWPYFTLALSFIGYILDYHLPLTFT